MTSYISTRGQAPRLNFIDVTLAGLATDGGLYVPEILPIFLEKDLAALAQTPYAETALRVMQPFIGDEIPTPTLAKIIASSCQNFDHAEVAPLRLLENRSYILELFHGPTLAFKDVALQFLGQVFDHILDRQKRRVTIIGATSGDTGSAAIHAFQGKSNADIFILHPHNRVSDVQRRQMTTVAAPNVFNIAIEGSFDDCQNIVKILFGDVEFRDELHLSAVNSINWARILAQIVYYVHASTRVYAATGKKPVFCVPTGNFGNIYAGYLAQRMGAPIGKLIAATNRNDILHRFFTTGSMKMETVIPSLSPSMDIQVSSNFERLLFDLCEKDGEKTARIMQQFRLKGQFQLDNLLMQKTQTLFSSGRTDDETTLDTMRHVWQKNQYLLDPHTAVGLSVAEEYRLKNPDSVVVTLATAHPAKFPDAVKQATGAIPPPPPQLEGLDARKEKFTIMPADKAEVLAFVRNHRRK